MGLVAEVGGAVEEVVSCAFWICSFFDLGEFEVPLDYRFEGVGEGGGDEVRSWVFVEGCFGGAEFID